MEQFDLSSQYRKQRDLEFVSKAQEIHKNFAKIYDGINPHGNVISDAFRSEIFRADLCTEESIIRRFGKSIPNSVVANAIAQIPNLVFEHDYVQIIKVRSWNHRSESIHGWIVTINRDHKRHEVDYNHRLTKGTVICTNNRMKSYSLLNLVHDTFCY